MRRKKARKNSFINFLRWASLSFYSLLLLVVPPSSASLFSATSTSRAALSPVSIAACRHGFTASCVASPAKKSAPANSGPASARLSPRRAPRLGCEYAPRAHGSRDQSTTREATSASEAGEALPSFRNISSSCSSALLTVSFCPRACASWAKSPHRKPVTTCGERELSFSSKCLRAGGLLTQNSGTKQPGQTASKKSSGQKGRAKERMTLIALPTSRRSIAASFRLLRAGENWMREGGGGEEEEGEEEGEEEEGEEEERGANENFC